MRRDPCGMELPDDVRRLSDATQRALELPGGQEILERMTDGTITVAEGMAQLAVLSGEYERNDDESAV